LTGDGIIDTVAMQRQVISMDLLFRLNWTTSANVGKKIVDHVRGDEND